MQVVDANGNVFGQGLEITSIDGKPKVPVINTDITIGTTVINGGVSGRLLFDNAGVVGETASINWNPSTSTLSLFDSPFISQAGNLSANTGFSIIGTTSSNYTISSSRQFIFNTGQSMYFNTDTDGGSALDRAWYFAGARTGMTGGRTYGALTVDSSGFPSFILYNNDNGARILLNSNAASYFNGGNLLVGTTTDAGFRFDVAGTIRSQGSLFISNPSFTLGGSITHSANATLVIAGGPGGGENITIGPSNRIFINAQQTRFPSGSVQIASTLSVGVANTTTATMLWVTGGITASSSIARGISLDTALTQSAANDVLTAVNIAPTFTVNNTLFHDVYWMRFTGSYVPASFTGNNNAATIDLSNSFTNANNAIGIRIRHTYSNVQNGYGILIESPSFIGIAQTSLTSTNFLAGTTVIGSSVVAPATGYTLHVTNNTNGAIKVGSASQANEHLVISHSQAGSTFSSIRNTFAATGATMLIDVAGQNNLRLFGTGNVAINNSTDAGFRLDVNGTARVQGLFYTTQILSAIGNLVIEAGASNTYVQIKPRTGATDGVRIETDQTDAGTTGEWSSFRVVGPIFSPTSGTRVRNFLAVTPTINQTGGANGITRGIYVNPTLTAAADFRAIETTAGNIIFNGGNIGVGISAPVVRYHQSQTQGILARYDITNANADQNRAVWEVYSNTAATPDFFGRFGFKFEGGANNAARQFQLHVGDNTTPRFVVNGSGNVLIGATTDAGFKLDVNGSLRTTGILYSNNNLAVGNYDSIISPSGSVNLSVYSNVQGTPGRLVVGGYATAGPTLNGIISFVNTQLNTFYPGQFEQAKIESYWAPNGQTGGDLRFYTRTYSIFGERLRITDVGNILINTTTDSGFRLDVNGTARVQGTFTISSTLNLPNTSEIVSGTAWGTGVLNFNNGPTTYASFQVANNRFRMNLTNILHFADSVAYIGTGDNYAYAFRTNNIERMRITSGGNMLIGTTTDSGYKLNVNGGGYFEGNLKVNGAITASIPTPNAYVCNIGLAADQSIASGSDVQIDFIDIDDTNNWYDPTTKRFTPTIAGYYHVDFTVWFDAATVSTGQYNIQIRKNASTVLIVQQPNINNGTGQSLTGSKLIYFNGTTDYIDFTAYQSTGVNRNLQAGASSSGTYASIFLLAV